MSQYWIVLIPGPKEFLGHYGDSGVVEFHLESWLWTASFLVVLSKSSLLGRFYGRDCP